MLRATFVDFLVPAREGGEEKEADECEDYGNDSAWKCQLVSNKQKRECKTHIK